MSEVNGAEVIKGVSSMDETFGMVLSRSGSSHVAGSKGSFGGLGVGEDCGGGCKSTTGVGFRKTVGFLMGTWSIKGFLLGMVA